MRRSRTALGALALIFAAAGRLPAQQPAADSILDRAVAALSRARTLRADFVQQVHDPMLGTDETSSGEILRRSPGEFAMRWRRPAGDLIIVNGGVLWVYLPSTAPKQAVRQTLSGKPGESADFVSEFLDHPRRRFAVSWLRADSVGGRAADVLALVPRQNDVPYRRMIVWVDREDGLVRRVQIDDTGGERRTITLDHLRLDAPIPASSFVFRPPRGVRVIDATE